MISKSLLDDINKEFNQYTYRAEVADDWTPIDLDPDFEGDCDSYATAKAEKLLKMGCPRSAIRIAWWTVKVPGKAISGHLTTLVTIGEGKKKQTYNLDNRFTFAKPVQELEAEGYVCIKLWHLDTGKWYLPAGIKFSS